MFTQAKQSDLDTNWPQPPSFDKNAPIQYPHKFEPSYLSLVKLAEYTAYQHELINILQ